MKIEATILVQELERTFSELIPLVEKLQSFTAEEMTNLVELADIGFATREASRHLDEFKKRVNELHRRAAQTCCITMAMTGQDIVRTDYCSASSNPKPWYKIPHKREQNPEKWDTIMDGIGVSVWSVANKRDLVRLHAPALMDYCGELIGEGLRPPLGIDPKEMTGMELNLRITKKR